MDFSYFNLVFISTEIAVKAVEKSEGASSSFLSVWWPTLGGLVGVIVTAVIGYLSNRPKHQHDQFKVFMDESSEFREEMRKEREGVKAELKEAKAKAESLQFELKACQVRMQTCSDDLEEYQSMLTKLKESFPKESTVKIIVDSKE